MSRWSSRAVTALLVAAMVTIAVPAMAADPGLETVSLNTTATEFDANIGLVNLSITGTGAAASVNFSTYRDGFEDEPADSGVPENWESATNRGSVEVSTDTTKSGSQSIFVNDTGTGAPQIRPFWQVATGPRTDNVSVSINSTSISQSLILYENGTPRVQVGMHRGDLAYFNGTDWLDIATAPDSGEWVDIEVSVNIQNDTFAVHWSEPGGASGTVTGLELRSGSWSGGYDQTRLSVSGDGRGYFDDFAIDGASSGTYVSGNHTASRVEQGWTDLTLSNATATVTWEYWDGNSWQAANSSTFASSGNHTLDLSGHASADKWRVNVTFERTGGNPTGLLADEGVQFNAATPTVNNAAADPQGEKKLTSSNPQLSIPVNDSDFATAQGDTVTVEFYLDGSKVATKTISSNQTVSYTASGLDGGNHTWHAEVSDSYGESATSNTFKFRVPSELRIYNESNVTQLVDNVSVELTFYFRNGTGTDFSVTKTTSDGTVNMTGLPADQPFVVVAEATDYYDRRVFVPSLYETQRVYLLPQNVTAVDTVFVIEDYTGDFPPDDTVLLVQRSLNGAWQTVLGDYFGATREFPGQVAYNERHRLVLMNVETGETKVMGTYTPITAATQEVVVSPSGDLTVRTAGATATIRPQLGQLPALNGTTVAVRFENNSATVANWTVNASVNGTTVWLQTYASPQRVTNDLDLAPYAGETLTVRVTYNDTNGTTFLVSERTFQIQQTLDNNATLLAAIQDFAQQSPQQNRGSFTAFLAMAITVLGMAGVASQFPVSSEVVALAGVFILTGFSVIGWVGYGLVFAAGVGTIAFAGLKRGL